MTAAIENKKMTLEEYEKKYSKKQNTAIVKPMAVMAAALVGLIIVAVCFFAVLRLFELNPVAGYIGIAASVAFCIFFFIIPVIKISKKNFFMVNVNGYNAKEAQKHNRALRGDIADKFIDITESTEGVGWYDSNKIGKLAIARCSKNDAEVKALLTDIFNTDIKKTADTIIRNHALKVGMATALSQSEIVDTLFIVFYELNLIKDLIFLYGFRPSDAKLMRIYYTIVQNALISYGITNLTTELASGVVKGISVLSDSIPILGSAVSTIISSASQGIINGSLTVVIGYQTLKYLRTEYRLQEVLDGIDLEEKDEKEVMLEVKDELINNIKTMKKKKATVE